MTNTKRAILVMGPPSSGTRLMMEILVRAGMRGNHEHEQLWDHLKPDPNRGGEQWICMRRHYPGERPPVWLIHPSLLQSLRGLGYQVDCIVMTRDWYHTGLSQMGAPHTGSLEEGIRQTRDCWNKIFHAGEREFLGNFIIVSYESLIMNPMLCVERIFDMMDLWEAPTAGKVIKDLEDNNFTIINANHKYDSTEG